MDIRNTLIIGSGPAGYTAAVYAARAGLKPLVLGGFLMGGQSGGQLMTTTEVENFPGFPEGVPGPELMDRLRRQAARFDAEILDKDVVKADLSRPPFRLTTDDAEYLAKTVILATGATARRLNTEAETRFWNKGISACATCDGALPLFRNKPIAVLGGGDSAMEETLFLTRFGSQVILLHRRNEFRASQIMLDRVRRHPKVSIKTPYVLEDALGENLLEKIRVKNLATGAVEELAANGLFLAIGHEPNTSLFKGQIELDEAGYVKTDGHARTNIPGVFAAGDCVDHTYRQAVTAAGMGCMAAIQAERYLEA
ncbi:MAG TPA: thioredoxin-disulfide reductase [Elusimicrobiota bacterium]|nr:thioredoxin-disulfide reductase [Elusimicrobiota bacterium]